MQLNVDGNTVGNYLQISFRTAHRNFTPKDVFNEELLENDTITDITRDKQ